MSAGISFCATRRTHLAVSQTCFAMNCSKSADHGGIDTDVLCLGREVPREDIVLGWEDADRVIGNAIMRMPAGHELLRDAASRAWSERQVEIWGHTGPRLLTELVRQHQLTQSVRPPPDLYPIHHSAAFDLIDPDACSMVEAVVANCPFLHFWHQKFRAGGFQTDFLPPEGSYLGEVLQRHGGRGKMALDGAAAQRQIKVVRDERAWRNAAAQLGAELDGLKRSGAPG
jgi:hypothetical protein